MTKAELAALKEELKAELLAEIRQEQKTGHWNSIRTELEKRLEHMNPMKRYQVTSAISTIIRHTLGISAIARLQDDQVDRARKIAFKILEAMGPVDEPQARASGE